MKKVIETFKVGGLVGGTEVRAEIKQYESVGDALEQLGTPETLKLINWAQMIQDRLAARKKFYAKNTGPNVRDAVQKNPKAARGKHGV